MSMNRSKKLNTLNISGGATKITGLAGAAKQLVKEKGFKPDVIAGVSAGSILCVIIALELWDEMDKLVTSFTLDDIFDKKPVNNKGNITIGAFFRLIWGFISKDVHYMGTQKNMPKTLAKIITLEKFEEYKNGDYPICYVGTVNFNTGAREFLNVKEMTYERYLLAVQQSANIPLAVESIKIDNNYYFDGGVRNHIPSAWILDTFNVKENVSIYSRPKDVSDILSYKWKPKNILEVFKRYVDITNVEISKKDEMLENMISEKKKIKNTQIFLPKVLKSLYDTNPKLLKELYQAGIDATNKYYLD
jgi:predicted acylesterase/phospholipase RssA